LQEEPLASDHKSKVADRDDDIDRERDSGENTSDTGAGSDRPSAIPEIDGNRAPKCSAAARTNVIPRAIASDVI
jgi:hypothetical protein